MNKPTKPSPPDSASATKPVLPDGSSGVAHRPRHRVSDSTRLLTGAHERPPTKQLRQTRRSLHSARWLIRQIAGWLLIALGIVGLVLPILQGFLFLSAGVVLVGRRSYPIRWTRVRIRLLVRRLAESERWWGRLANKLNQQMVAWRHRSREKHWRKQLEREQKREQKML